MCPAFARSVSCGSIKWKLWTTLYAVERRSVKSTKTLTAREMMTMMNTSQFSFCFSFFSRQKYLWLLLLLPVCRWWYGVGCCRINEYSLRVAWFSKSFWSFILLYPRLILPCVDKYFDEENVRSVLCVGPCLTSSAKFNSVPFYYFSAKHHTTSTNPPHLIPHSNGCVTFIDSLTLPTSNQMLMPL